MLDSLDHTELVELSTPMTYVAMISMNVKMFAFPVPSQMHVMSVSPELNPHAVVITSMIMLRHVQTMLLAVRTCHHSVNVSEKFGYV